MKRLLRPLIWALVLALIALGLFQAFRPQPVAVDLASVTRGPLQVTIQHEGRTRVKDRFVISSPLAGRLQRIALKPGDPVTAGETLMAVLEPTDPELLNPRALAQAEARVKAAEAAAKQAEPVVERAQSMVDLTTKELNRLEDLVPLGGAARVEYDTAVQKERAATEDLHAAEFAAKVAQFELELARAALLFSKPKAPGDADQGPRLEIRAPITGRVFRVFEESSTIVAAGTRLLEVADPANIEIEVDVLSTDAVKVHPGTPVIVEHWGGDHDLEARVRMVEPSAFTKISALGIEEQRVNVIADFTGPAEKREALGDGYRIEARLVIWHSDDVLKAPAGALFREAGQWSVFVAENGTAHLRSVQIGHRNDLEAEILDGLNAEDRVIVYPSDQIEEGTRLKGE
ncbi:MAG: HlyD family efflux transporter periplasmic adaptor subunit [Verrucomicrobiales bacterium]|nr:HlyD family efflux transporter periplasmic adaptor subunit [Verrucomicrobiales bacterium]